VEQTSNEILRLPVSILVMPEVNVDLAPTCSLNCILQSMLR
jgi:hypothetical protein